MMQQMENMNPFNPPTDNPWMARSVERLKATFDALAAKAGK